MVLNLKVLIQLVIYDQILKQITFFQEILTNKFDLINYHKNSKEKLI